MSIPNGVTVRPVEGSELDAWWDLRLRGLRDHPSAFGSDYEEAKARGPAYLEDSLREGSLNRIFGAFTASGEIVAQAAVWGNTGRRRHIATIGAVHTHAAWRGRALSRALIALAIAHCRAFPAVMQITIAVNAENAAALAVYEGAGFVAWGREPRALRTDAGFHDEIHMLLTLDGI